MTVDPDLLEWTGVLAVAAAIFLTGRAIGLRNKRPAKPQYKCSTCSHGIGYHQDQKGRCRQVSSDTNWMPCKCTTYVGDRPPPSYEELIKQ